ncbi:hypothetical protein H6P81_011194 [Aristolochia fimbriata]|uniref:HAT C-terminal dimerisation domain-containing protein n=1 Tax=Aristolochia fimbriata TaxID=158543 RepID=A0AAV7ERI8_ARIFI|nr:hypothetical protein H6P81_011194 [Aristolochia fimbriata]
MRHFSIPVSTVASEAAFSTGGSVIDQYISSLKPKTGETLLCTQDCLICEMKGSLDGIGFSALYIIVPTEFDGEGSEIIDGENENEGD